MATTRPLLALAHSQPAFLVLSNASRIRIQHARPITAALFSTSSPRFATPAGVSPTGLRVNRPDRWDEEKESTMDKASKYFLLTEIFRGMYVVLEQFFRPP
jgi:NADH dehydrogenase (ubiquinone) Fe-S protein 8